MMPFRDIFCAFTIECCHILVIFLLCYLWKQRHNFKLTPVGMQYNLNGRALEDLAVVEIA